MRILSLLKLLDSSELLDFETFIGLKTIKKGDELPMLLSYLIANKSWETGLEEKAVFEFVFGGEKVFKRHKLQRAFSNLSLLLEHFMACIEMKGHPVQQDVLLSGFLTKRNADKIALRQLKQSAKTVKLTYGDGMWRWYNEILLLHHQYFLPLTNKGKTEKAEELLEEIRRTIQQFSLNAKIRYEFEHTKYASKKKEKTPITEHKPPYPNHTFSIYKRAIKLLTSQDFGLIEEWESIFKENAATIYSLDKTAIATSLTNHAIKIINSGEKTGLAFAFRLYEGLIAAGALNDGDFIHTEHFINYVWLAIINKEKKLAVQFMENHLEMVNPFHQKETEQICKARIAFFDKNFEETIRLISSISFKNRPQLSLRLRPLELCAIFEEEEAPYFINYCRNYNFFILKQKKGITSERKKSNINFIQWIKRIHGIKGTYQDKAKLKIMYDKIKAEKHLIYKKWLLEKVSELKGIL